MQITGIRRRRKQCKERAEWKRITQKAKPTVGCIANRRRRRRSRRRRRRRRRIIVCSKLQVTSIVYRKCLVKSFIFNDEL